MRTTLTLALVVILFVMLAGGVAVAMAAPWWLAGLYGVSVAWAVPSVAEAVGRAWTVR